MRRLATFGVVSVVVVGLLVGSSGFTTVDAQRAVSVVVSEDEPLVGVTACEKNRDRPGSGSEPVRVRVSNALSEAVSVTGITSGDAPRRDESDRDRTVGPGDRERIEVVFSGDVATVRVTVDGATTDVTVTRPVASAEACPFGPGRGEGSRGGSNATGG